MNTLFAKFHLGLFWTPHVDPGTAAVEPINVTTQASMSPTMKTFYDTTLLENARENMVFEQFGKTQPMKGKTVEWRKFNTFGKALTPLTEGVIPSGQNFGMTAITASTTQHGDYTAVSDRLELESYDDVIFGATEEMGAAEGETFDTLTRNILVAGNSVAYCPTVSGGIETEVTSRLDLDNTAILTPKEVAKAATWLKKCKAPQINGSYVAVVHPSVAHDLRQSDEWKDFHKYADVKPIFKGEIGELHGVRFVESNNAKIFRGVALTASAPVLTVKTAIASSSTTVAVNEAISADEATAMAGTEIWLGGVANTIASASAGTAGNATLTIGTAVTTLAKNAKVAAKGGTKDGNAVYATLFFGKDAFGLLDPQGEGMEMIVKTRGEIGGPLEQFSTIGYKFCHAAKILYQERMLRVESGSSYGSVDAAN